MKYKVLNKNYYLGRVWQVGETIDFDPKTNPPRHFKPLSQVVETPKPPPLRTEPMEMEPGKMRKPVGGMSHGLDTNELPRTLTTDVVPNDNQTMVTNPRVRKRRKKKDAGSVKKSD
jgi:hypothetical protein